jgi:hypothetical protein
VRYFGRATVYHDDFFWLRVVGGTTAATLAVLSTVAHGIGSASLLLFGVAAVVLTFPWHRLAALKAGPFEFSLEQGQIRGAIDSIDLQGPEKERIERALSRLTADIELARGGRVLWVDDKPTRVVGERRLFRALGIKTVVVPTCRDAAMTLTRDNDFDLVITSLEKLGEKHAIDDLRNPGVLFVRWLRGREDKGILELLGEDLGAKIDDAVINDLGVIFYAAFQSLTYVLETIQPLNELAPVPEASKSLDDLLKKAIRSLADRRSNPIEVSINKKVRATGGTSSR